MGGDCQRTARTALTTTWLVALALAGARGGVVSATQSTPAGARSAWSGVYTDAQAERGSVLYLRSCSVCHGRDLRGNSAEEIPSLTGNEFMEGWTGEPLISLVDRVSIGMPNNNPGSLNAGEYLDLIAYLLRANGFPSGAAELPQNRDELGRIMLTRPDTSRDEPRERSVVS